MIETKSGDKEPKFEEALKQLESIVGELEDGDLELDISLQLFEDGVALSRVMKKRLDAAEKKIEELTRDQNGLLTVKQMTDSSAAGSSEDPPF